MKRPLEQSMAGLQRPPLAGRVESVLRWIALASVLAFGASMSAAFGDPADEDYSFVVVGHLRSWESGRVNSLLDETMQEIERLGPQLIFIVGDSIWGDVMLPYTDPQIIGRDWEELDSRLGELGTEILRVPGNHDIHDPVTRDIFFARYGSFPRAVSFRGSLFLLLNSTFVPKGDASSRKYITSRRLSENQVQFLTDQISSSPAKHIFVFMHHVLWWHDDAPWWSEVHPLLVGSNVRAVFSGDLGPTKFSHTERDGVQYVRTALEDDFSPERQESIEALQASAGDFLLSQQFDNFVTVQVDGDRVHFSVIPIGAFSSGKHSPEFWQEVRGRSPVIERWDYDPAAEQETGLWQRLLSNRRRLAKVATIAATCFIVGWLAGAYWISRH